jgi:methylthioribulose-1-phosphate dehydratase
MGIEESRNTLIQTAREFYQRGWMLGTSGNLSIRTQESPLQFLITASGRDKGSLTEQDILLIAENGLLVEPSSLKPSAETAVHEKIYGHFSAGAVYHVHSVSAALLCHLHRNKSKVTFSSLEMIKGLDIWDPKAIVELPIVTNHAEIPELASEIIRHSNSSTPGILIRNHGLYAWGKTSFEAKRHVEIFEYLFQYNIGLAMLR